MIVRLELALLLLVRGITSGAAWVRAKRKKPKSRARKRIFGRLTDWLVIGMIFVRCVGEMQVQNVGWMNERKDQRVNQGLPLREGITQKLQFLHKGKLASSRVWEGLGCVGVFMY